MKFKKLLTMGCAVVMTLSAIAVTPLSEIVTNQTKVYTADVIPSGYTPIYTFEDLYAIRNNLSGNYILMNDIDMTELTAPGGDWDINGTDWEPIGTEQKPYTGSFNGNGYAIIGMNIHGAVQYTEIGLFGSVFKTIFKLKMLDVNINITSIPYTAHVGAISGRQKYSSYVSDCFATGNIYVDSSKHSSYAGGLIGNDDRGYIYNCYNACNVQTNYKNDNVGGIVGYIDGNGVDSEYVGECYNTGEISSTYNNTYCGSITNVSLSKNHVYDCYYLNGTCSTQTSVSGRYQGLTTGQMKSESAFSGWDFDNTWIIDSTSSYKYPQLRKCMQIPITEVELVYAPDKVEYVQGESLNINGGYIGVYYELDNTYGETAIRANMLGSYNMNAIGLQTILVTYVDKSTSFDIVIYPKATSGVKAGTATANSATFSWTKDTNATGYLVYKYVSGEWQEYEYVTGTSFTDYDVSPAYAYKYAVATYKTVDGVEYLGKKTEIELRTNPSQVSGLKSTSQTQTGISLSWSALNGATGYEVYQYNTNTNQYVLSKTVVGATSCTVSALKSNTSYMFKVRAYKTFGSTKVYGEYSAALKISTKPLINVSSCSISGVKASYVYTGSAIKPTITVKNGSTTLVSGTDYTVTFSANTNPGLATVKITGKGNYSGTSTTTFQILPKATAVKTAYTCTTTAIRINWTKDAKATGYRVYRWNGSEYVSVATISNNSTVT